MQFKFINWAFATTLLVLMLIPLLEPQSVYASWFVPVVGISILYRFRIIIIAIRIMLLESEKRHWLKGQLQYCFPRYQSEMETLFRIFFILVVTGELIVCGWFIVANIYLFTAIAKAMIQIELTQVADRC
ncbi:hypothetical protein HGT71_14305 [Rosenbergiella epipactidis]|uniref:hypothetical protein n=1 Tax=Rosenbergiella epipactidis TaxID=1544694 RepID=UPI001BDAA2D7|nr:hypothetical protein [Rosenbergiella epipactidis]MBT0719418.1 hypothetical protein [Rosenbergiella epipactidis]